MTLYLLGASLVFCIALDAFLKDESTPKSDVLSWLVLLVATLIWPVVLPRLIWKKFQKFSRILRISRRARQSASRSPVTNQTPL